MEKREQQDIMLRAERRRLLRIAMSKKNDKKSRAAREDFRRPAFYGTVLESQRQK